MLVHRRTSLMFSKCFVTSIVVLFGIAARFVAVDSVRLGDYRKQSIRMVGDVQRIEQLPTNVFWNTCWSAHENVAALRELECPATVWPVQSIRDDENRTTVLTSDVNSNLVLMVLDLYCVDLVDGWLAKVSIR